MLLATALLIDDMVIGFLAAILMGALLGILGGGGSILTVPILVYLCRIEPILASSYSLWVVGIASLVGAIRYARTSVLPSGLILMFGAPSILGVVIARAVLLPNIPNDFSSFIGIHFTKDLLILVLFALLMIAAGIALIYQQENGKDANPPVFKRETPARSKILALVAEGFLTGVLTGMVGAGGGFMIVPVLVILVGLPMKIAVGTSLAIISLKSFSGILADAFFWQNADWQFLTLFSTAAIVGILIGSRLANKIPARPLKVGFGWFALLLGIFILSKELVLSRLS